MYFIKRTFSIIYETKKYAAQLFFDTMVGPSMRQHKDSRTRSAHTYTEIPTRFVSDTENCAAPRRTGCLIPLLLVVVMLAVQSKRNAETAPKVGWSGLRFSLRDCHGLFIVSHAWV